jgi:hypothetical protein
MIVLLPKAKTNSKPPERSQDQAKRGWNYETRESRESKEETTDSTDATDQSCAEPDLLARFAPPLFFSYP